MTAPTTPSDQADSTTFRPECERAGIRLPGWLMSTTSGQWSPPYRLTASSDPQVAFGINLAAGYRPDGTGEGRLPRSRQGDL